MNSRNNNLVRFPSLKIVNMIVHLWKLTSSICSLWRWCQESPGPGKERKGDVNMKLWERKFDEEERKQIMNNDFDTEEVWDDDVHNLEGGKTNQIVS